MVSIRKVLIAANVASEVYEVGVPVVLDRNLVGPSGEMRVQTELIDFDRSDYTHCAVVGLSGTDDLEYWHYNVDTQEVGLPIKGLGNYYCHHGYHTLANEVLETVTAAIGTPEDNREVILTGHSAGAATALVLSLLLVEKGYAGVSVVTFGCPRVFTTRGDTQTFPIPHIRFQSPYDLVPCAPLTWRGPLPDYRHNGLCLWTTDTPVIPPKYRVLKLLYRYARSLVSVRPFKSFLSTVKSEHSMSGYFSWLYGNHNSIKDILGG